VRISVTRTGGYAGLSEQIADVDTERMPKAAAARIVSLVDAGKFFALPDRVPSTKVGADMFRYEITVEDGSRRHTVAFLDDDSPSTAGLRQLVASLQP
jgi:hypothetical protein